MKSSAVQLVETKCKEIRKIILSTGFNTRKAVHYGGSLSMVEILSCIYFGGIGADPDPSHPEAKNHVILSKGHGGLGLYACLRSAGIISKDSLDTYLVDGSDFCVHPVKNLKCGIEASTGSLGQGVCFSLGLAMGLMMQNTGDHVFCIVGDGECNEGSVYEAVRLWGQLGLKNYTLIVDRNGYQNDGPTDQIMRNRSLSHTFESFGLRVEEVNGHDVNALLASMNRLSEKEATVILADTVKGCGVRFMEGNNEWHHNVLTSKLYENALGF